MTRTMSHTNRYRRRQVNQANEKSCAICHRPTDVVLMSTDSKDWFYCCAQHLKDPGLATPVVDEKAHQERLKKIEIAKVKAEYEQKEKERESKKSSSWLPNPFAQRPEEPTTIPEPDPIEPREFVLHRTLYQHRVNLKLQAAQQKARDAQWSTIQFPNAPGSIR